MRETEPPKRPNILESSQQRQQQQQQESAEINQPLKGAEQNHVSKLSRTKQPEQQQVIVEHSETTSDDSNRLSNGLEPHQAATTDNVVTTTHSPRTSALRESHLSTLSNESNSSVLSNGVGFSVEQEVSSTGEESSMEVVEDSEARSRHKSARSITEETRELDEFLNRSSVTSILTDSQVSSMDTNLQSATAFERVGSGSGEEDLEGEVVEANMVSGRLHQSMDGWDMVTHTLAQGAEKNCMF